jgi:hypothetical protein
MSDFLTRNRLVLAEIEVTSGTDPTPTAADNAVLVEEPRGTPQFELIQTDEVSGSLDHTQSIVGGGFAEHVGRFYAKGSGVAGTLPEYAPYLQAAALGVTTLASDEDDTAQAGASGSITLAAGATSSDLTGFVITLDGGTGSGQTRVITGYNGTTKVATVYPNWTTPPDATSTYVVSAGNRFAPASTSLKTMTEYLYKKNSGGGNAILEKLIGAAANLSFNIQTRQAGLWSYTLRGLLSAPAGVSNPSAGTFDSVRPRPLRDADAWLGGAQVCFRNFTFDLGNQLIQGDCPGAEFGYDPARVIDRRITGRLNPQLLVLSSRDPFADLAAGTTKALWLNWGETAGNRVSIFFPAIAYTGKEDDDLDGLSADGLPFEATGIDAGFYYLVY